MLNPRKPHLKDPEGGRQSPQLTSNKDGISGGRMNPLAMEGRLHALQKKLEALGEKSRAREACASMYGDM